MFKSVKSGQVTEDLLSKLGCVITVSQEKIPENGEDSYCHLVNESHAMVAVFDGCGGAGARQYPAFRNKTGAYMASRAASAATYKWFSELSAHNAVSCSEATELLKAFVQKNLSLCEEYGAARQSAKLRGSITKNFPTTAAVITAEIEKMGLRVNCYWAGDSRGYLLDANGLAQLSDDDLNVKDAFENLTADGILTNVISSSKDFKINQNSIFFEGQGIMLAATDGCFGYVSTPMEFENMLLAALMVSNSAAQWEKNLTDLFSLYAADDFTLCAIVCGFDTFDELKTHFKIRYDYLNENYISSLKKCSQEEKKKMWESYRPGYYRYIG